MRGNLHRARCAPEHESDLLVGQTNDVCENNRRALAASQLAQCRDKGDSQRRSLDGVAGRLRRRNPPLAAGLANSVVGNAAADSDIGG